MTVFLRNRKNACALLPETIHTPQGDEKLLLNFIWSSFPGNNSHPARGRKPRLPTRGTARADRNNPHPARGRKPNLSILKELAIDETIHTPQGDENVDLLLSLVYLLTWNNPHPARGRKRFFTRQGCNSPGLETIHTPQGDENAAQIFSILDILVKQFTPRKGTKTLWL